VKARLTAKGEERRGDSSMKSFDDVWIYDLG